MSTLNHLVVTGGRGFVGSHLIRRLLRDQPSLRITVPTRQGAHAASQPYGVQDERVRYVTADLHDDVPAGAGDDVEVGSNLNEVELTACLLARARALVPAHDHGRRDYEQANRGRRTVTDISYPHIENQALMKARFSLSRGAQVKTARPRPWGVSHVYQALFSLSG